MSKRPMVNGNSPWGSIQHVTAIDKENHELLIVDTAGHGGMWIGPSLMPRFRQLFPDFKGYAGLPWLEEDCDICLGVIAFPEFFTPEKVELAKQTARNMRDYFVSANQMLDRMEHANV